MQIIRARARAGHPWVFANDILDPPVAALKPGGTVEVLDSRGQFVGRGYANPHSLIAVRMLTGSRVEIDAEFFRERLRRAVALRERVLPGRRSYRLCAGEADGMGGLVLDRFGDVLVAQITTLGMESRRDALAEAIEDVVAPRGVVARDDASARGMEGLGGEARLWFGEVPERVVFEEAGVAMEADPWRGQKTGYFFDQADNRAFLRARASGARVLDLYSNTGAWALQALAGGAVEAVAVESSMPTASLDRKSVV